MHTQYAQKLEHRKIYYSFNACSNLIWTLHTATQHTFLSLPFWIFFEFNNYAERYFQKNNHNKDEVVTGGIYT